MDHSANTYPVVLATDENYAAPCAVVIESLLQNTANPSAIDFYIYESNLAAETKRRLEAVADYHGASLRIRAPDMRRLQKLPLRENFTAVAYNKLLAPNDFAQFERLLYLDCDVLVERDILPLFNADLDDNIAGGVPNGPAPFIERFNSRHGFPENAPVFNTGVLLIDPEKWKDNEVSSRAVDWIEKNKNNLIYRDQDGINIVIKDDIKSIDPCWNMEARHYREKMMGISNWWDKIEEDVILHYTGSRKPWKPWTYVPRQRRYREYLKATPFFRSGLMPESGLVFEVSRRAGWLRLLVEAGRVRAGRMKQTLLSS